MFHFRAGRFVNNHTNPHEMLSELDTQFFVTKKIRYHGTQMQKETVPQEKQCHITKVTVQ